MAFQQKRSAMINWKDMAFDCSAKLGQIMTAIERSEVKIVLIVDNDGQLVGTINDGDVRRAMLKGATIDSKGGDVMNTAPLQMHAEMSQHEALNLMGLYDLQYLPRKDIDGKLCGLETIQSLQAIKKRENPVVIMAGGMGNRLRPLTEDCPKPMLKIGGRPILETILLSLTSCGFHKIFMSVNYRADSIIEHFRDGREFDAEISYLKEDKFLGTAGALSMLPANNDLPLILMNADILTKINFEKLLSFHESKNAVATMCVKETPYEIPYGVAEIKDSKILSIQEKPVHSYFVNTGIYALSAEVPKSIPKGVHLNITDVFGNLIKQSKEVVAFTTREYWLDIGEISSFEKARLDFNGHFLNDK